MEPQTLKGGACQGLCRQREVRQEIQRQRWIEEGQLYKPEIEEVREMAANRRPKQRIGNEVTET